MNKDGHLVPDYKNWLRRALWRLNEATSLLLNVEPKKVEDLIQSDENFKIEFEEALAIVVIAERIELEVIGQTFSHANGVTYAEVKPKIHIQWAHSKGYEIPSKLKGLLQKDSGINKLTELPNLLQNCKYWKGLEKKALKVIEEYPEWSKAENKVSLTGNLMDWLNSKEITNTTREAEILKKYFDRYL